MAESDTYLSDTQTAEDFLSSAVAYFTIFSIMQE